MQFIRVSDWEDRLRTYLDRVTEERFVWGSHDCALFTAGAVKAMTETDPAEAFRGTYDSEVTARESLRANGAGTLLKTVTSLFGAHKPIQFAQRGDLVMLDRKTLGVSVGVFSWFAGQEGDREGLVHLPTAACKYAFSVPFEAAQ
jgi:hypothetical protein